MTSPEIEPDSHTPVSGDLRASEERYRSLFEKMTEGFALHGLICDEHGRSIDYRFLDINAAFEQLTGLKREHVVGRLVSELLPGETHWIEIYGKVVQTGESIRFEEVSQGLDKAFEVYAYRPAPSQFAVIFTEITERKSTALQLGEREENFA